MKIRWQKNSVPLKFMLSDKTLFTKDLKLNVRSLNLTGKIDLVNRPLLPNETLEQDYDGFLIRSLPISQLQPSITHLDNYICYVPSQYQRYYINLENSFDDYRKKFSAKSRSTINRKIKKFSKKTGGEITCKSYKSVTELPIFYQHAREVSSKSYQEKLLDAGLPDTQEFQDSMLKAASEDAVRAYLLFDEDKPIAYMYCPINDGALLYQYLGYDPDYMKWSVGTILHWRAFEEIFNENRHKIFDFTEGQSEHKRQFSTDSVLCANVFFIRKSFSMNLILRLHHALETFSNSMGALLDKFGVKAKIKKIIRFR